MKRGGHAKVDQLVDDFRTKSRFDLFLIEEIFACGHEAVPHLESILADVLNQSEKFNLTILPGNVSWFAPANSLFMLAHLRSEKSLNVVLKFFAQKEKVLSYWLDNLFNDDVWEVLYLLGRNQVAKLQKFTLNKRHDTLARLAVCTALIQISLNFELKKNSILDIFKGLLQSDNEDSEFMGLLVSELVDLKEASLRPLMIKALEKNQVWSGIISPEEVNSAFKNESGRKREPLDFLQRFEYLKQSYTYSSTTSSRTFPKKSKRILEKSL